jgi:hypothetical protein
MSIPQGKQGIRTTRTPASQNSRGRASMARPAGHHFPLGDGATLCGGSAPDPEHRPPIMASLLSEPAWCGGGNRSPDRLRSRSRSRIAPGLPPQQRYRLAAPHQRRPPFRGVEGETLSGAGLMYRIRGRHLVLDVTQARSVSRGVRRHRRWDFHSRAPCRRRRRPARGVPAADVPSGPSPPQRPIVRPKNLFESTCMPDGRGS